MPRTKHHYPDNIDELLQTRSICQLARELGIPERSLHAHIYYIRRCAVKFCYQQGARTYHVQIKRHKVWLCDWHRELAYRWGATEWLSRFEDKLRE